MRVKIKTQNNYQRKIIRNVKFTIKLFGVKSLYNLTLLF